MPGLIVILASEPWGPVRIETVADLADVMVRGFRPAYSADVGDRDLGQVAAVVRSRLPPADGLGMIAAGLDRATAAIAGAFSAVPAVAIPLEVEDGAGGAGCKPASDVEARDMMTNDVTRPAVSMTTNDDADVAGSRPNVRALRTGLKLSQEAFASRFALPIGTVREWEQGRTAPDAAARALLRVIGYNPDMVRQALAGGEP